MKTIFRVLVAALYLLMLTAGLGQSQVFLDDFNRPTLTIGAPTTYTTTVTAGDGGAGISAGSFLELTNDASASTNANGIVYLSGLSSDFSAPFSQALVSNPGPVEWTFNFRFNRTANPAGFSAGNYGVAIILAASNGVFAGAGAGNGYAIAYGNTSTPDPIRLVRFAGGMTGSLTNIVSSGVDDIANVNNYVSVRVTYDPDGDLWALFLRDDGTGSWGDPATGVTDQVGFPTSDNTYTSIPLTHFGFYWSYASAANQTSQFDNFRVMVTSCPNITSDPQDQIVCSGSSVSFTASASGNPIPTVQWQESSDGGLTFDNVGGATSTTFTFTPNITQDGQLYRAVFANSCRTVATLTAVLTVSPTSVGGTPIAADANVVSGTGTTISLTGHTGNIQWQFSADGIDFFDIAGETGTSLSTGPLTETTHFRAVVTSGVCPSENSTAATVTVTSPPSLSSIFGTVFVDGSGLAGVLVKLLDEFGDPVAGITDQTSDANGEYSFANLDPGNYQVMIVEPLGYSVDGNPNSTIVLSGEVSIVNFILTQVVVVNNSRSMGYWKHQFDVYVTNRGQAQETASGLQDYINTIHQRYTPHYAHFDGINTFAQWQNVLSVVRGNQPMSVRAKQQLAALLFNLVSLKIGQHTVVTDDSRTAGDVLTYVSELLSDTDSSNDERAKDLAEMVNLQQVIGAGIVPQGNLLYKGNGSRIRNWGFDLPEDYSLYQNFPNPFNPRTEIQFDLPEDSYVKILVYDVLGRVVATIADGAWEAGRYFETWDARSISGRRLASGVYFYRIEAKSLQSDRSLVTVKKMLLSK